MSSVQSFYKQGKWGRLLSCSHYIYLVVHAREVDAAVEGHIVLNCIHSYRLPDLCECIQLGTVIFVLGLDHRISYGSPTLRAIFS